MASSITQMDTFSIENIVFSVRSYFENLSMRGYIGFGIALLSIPFFTPALRRYCLPFVPSRQVQLNNIYTILAKSKKGKLIDLGSGDGRIVIGAAIKGFEATGVELNFWLLLVSKIQAFRNGVEHRTSFVKQDFWKVDLTKFDYIVVFGINRMMWTFEEKILKEAKNNTTILTCRYPFPNLKPIEIVGTGKDTVYVYKKIADKSE